MCQKVVKKIINKANNMLGDCYLLLVLREHVAVRYIEVGGLAQQGKLKATLNWINIHSM